MKYYCIYWCNVSAPPPPTPTPLSYLPSQLSFAQGGHYIRSALYVSQIRSVHFMVNFLWKQKQL